MEVKFTAQPDCIDMPHHAIQHQGYAWLASMLCIAYTFYNLNYMSEILEGWGLHWSLLIHHDVVAQVPWSKIAFFMISLEISHLELWLAISSSHRSWRLYASWGLALSGQLLRDCPICSVGWGWGSRCDTPGSISQFEWMPDPSRSDVAQLVRLERPTTQSKSCEQASVWPCLQLRMEKSCSAE